METNLSACFGFNFGELSCRPVYIQSVMLTCVWCTYHRKCLPSQQRSMKRKSGCFPMLDKTFWFHLVPRFEFLNALISFTSRETFLKKCQTNQPHIKQFILKGSIEHCQSLTTDWIVPCNCTLCPNVDLQYMNHLQCHEISKLISAWR